MATTAGLVLAGAWASEIQALSIDPEMRLGLVTYLWGQDLDLEALLSTCREGGLGGVELRTTHAHGVEPTLDAEARARVKTAFADSGIELVGLGSDERLCWPEAARLAAAKAKIIEFLQLSHDTGGSGVKVKPDSFHEGVPREQTIEQIGSSLKELGPRAADLGQQIRVEIHGSCASPEVIRDIMAVADHPSVAVCWNCNEADLRGKGLRANFNMVRPRFGETLHVRHLSRHAYPYEELFRLLHESNWNGWMLLEARGDLPVKRAEAFREQRDLFLKHRHSVVVPTELKE